MIKAKGITVSDKAEIYKILTGKDYSAAKQGRPSKARRNFEVALEFLYLMGTTDNSKKAIVTTLANLFEISGGEANLQQPEREMGDVNFHKIVVQQLDKLESYLLQNLDAVDHGELEMDSDTYNNCKACLNGLARYKARK